jgi:hypothetical protein
LRAGDQRDGSEYERAVFREVAAHGPGCLKCALDDAAVDAERGACCCRGEWARNVGDKTGNLLRCGEALDERSRANLFEELGLELLEAFVAALRQGTSEIDDAARLGRACQHAIDGNAGAGDRLG